MLFLNYKPLKLYLRVFVAGHTVAMVTMCAPMVKQCFDTMIEASSDKKWL